VVFIVYITNITEIRQNASKVITRAVQEKEPTVILQRSKPVAYIVEASLFENIQKKLERAQDLEKTEQTKAAFQKISAVMQKMKQRDIQHDSTGIIRELREGIRNE